MQGASCPTARKATAVAETAKLDSHGRIVQEKRAGIGGQVSEIARAAQPTDLRRHSILFDMRRRGGGCSFDRALRHVCWTLDKDMGHLLDDDLAHRGVCGPRHSQNRRPCNRRTDTIITPLWQPSCRRAAACPETSHAQRGDIGPIPRFRQHFCSSRLAAHRLYIALKLMSPRSLDGPHPLELDPRALCRLFIGREVRAQGF